MSVAITVDLDAPDPEECPANLTEMYDGLRTRLSATLNATIIPYITGAETPGVDDQDKVWHRVDADGRPLGTYVFYDGTWRKQYTANIGQIVMYSGDPGTDFAGTDGAGTIGGEWDGWQLCNGENGAPNLSDKFIAGAKMDDLAVGYPEGNGPWKSTVSGETTQEGTGVHEIQLTAGNTYRRATAALTLGHWEADVNTPNVGGGLIGLSGGGADFNLIEADAGNPTPPVIPTLPPWYACALVIFQGYQ